MLFKLNLSIITFLTCLIFISSCQDYSIDTEPMFEISEKFINTFSLDEGISTIIVTNPVGAIYLDNTFDSTEVEYLLYKTVKLEDKLLSEAELENINISFMQIQDSLFISVDSPVKPDVFYKSSISLKLPAKMNIIVKTPHKGVRSDFLNSKLYVESDYYDINIFQHKGSLNINSLDGDVNASIWLVNKDSCNITTNSGNVILTLPPTISSTTYLETVSGNIGYEDIDISISQQTKYKLFGTIGDGESVIKIVTNSGNILLEGY